MAETDIGRADRAPNATDNARPASVPGTATTPSSHDPDSSQKDGPVVVEEEDDEPDDFHPGWRLWAIIGGMTVALILTALENTAISVALPVIASDLGLGENYIWVTNGFFIAG